MFRINLFHLISKDVIGKYYPRYMEEIIQPTSTFFLKIEVEGILSSYFWDQNFFDNRSSQMHYKKRNCWVSNHDADGFKKSSASCFQVRYSKILRVIHHNPTWFLLGGKDGLTFEIHLINIIKQESYNFYSKYGKSGLDKIQLSVIIKTVSKPEIKEHFQTW